MKLESVLRSVLGPGDGVGNRDEIIPDGAGGIHTGKAKINSIAKRKNQKHHKCFKNKNISKGIKTENYKTNIKW